MSDFILGIICLVLPMMLSISIILYFENSKLRTRNKNLSLEMKEIRKKEILREIRCN